MNCYKEEFDEVISIDEFSYWVTQNVDIFIANMKNINRDSDASLRYWIKIFLLWSEYEANKRKENENYKSRSLEYSG